MTTVVDLKVKEVHPSPFNHRKAFRDMEQLAESIKARGVLQPITVRPNNKGWEIIFGERRWRASKLAGVETIPAIERHMTDVEVLEAQLIENVQRSDVHALEEADGYKELLDKHKYTVEQLVAKTGKSKAYIYARLKLCELAPVPRKAFLEDRLNASVALLIARIPDAKLQAQACEEVLSPNDWAHRFEIEDDDGKVRSEVIPLSVRHAQAHVIRRYMLKLELAPFDTTDAGLVPKVGACTTCPHRTGNQRELFADVKSGDVCTNPPCFETKKNADFDKRAAEATRTGVRVLTAKENKSIFSSYGGADVGYQSAYIDPNGQLPYDLNPSGRSKTWKQLLGKEQPAQVLARDAAGNARILLDKKSAIAKLEKSGKLKELKAESRASSTGNNKYKEQEAKRQKEAKRRHKVARLAFAKIHDKAKDAAGDKFWQWLALGVLRMMDAEDQRNLCKRRELETKLGNGDAEKALAAIIKQTKGVDQILALVVEFVAAFRAVGGLWGGKQFGDNFVGACEVLGIDIKKLTAQVVADEKAKAKPKAKGK